MITLLLILVLAQAQDFDYGKPAELRGLTKVHVYTDLDLKSRNAIIKEIEKKLPTITIVERREEADVWLIYAQDVRRDFRGVVGNGQSNSDGSVNTTATPVYGKTISGVGYVVRPGSANKRDRLLMDFRDEKRSVFSHDPTGNFARAFIKAYKEANK